MGLKKSNLSLLLYEKGSDLDHELYKVRGCTLDILYVQEVV